MRCFEDFKDDRICDMCGSKIRCKAETEAIEKNWTGTVTNTNEDRADTPEDFTYEEFSAMNEEEAQKYIGERMEFANGHGVRSKEWVKGVFSAIVDKNFPFKEKRGLCFQFIRTCPETFICEYFNALNEKEAEKYIGKTMEFADSSQIRKNIWVKDELSGIGYNAVSFETHDSYWQFMRTCPETFLKRKVKKTVERRVNINKSRFEEDFRLP